MYSHEPSKRLTGRWHVDKWAFGSPQLLGENPTLDRHPVKAAASGLLRIQGSAWPQRRQIPNGGESRSPCDPLKALPVAWRG
jgi:hypothetical protein